MTNMTNNSIISNNISNLFERTQKYNYTLVAVTKTRSIEDIKQILSAGILHIAENRVQEAEQKLFSLLNIPFQNVSQNVLKHMIGHLQINKVKKAVALFDIIQSVDSIQLAEKINAESQKLNKAQQIMLQINIGEEPQKSGFSKQEIYQSFEKIRHLSNIKIIGLMCIAPDIKLYGEQRVRLCFKEMKSIFEKFNSSFDAHLIYLSMGMSDDYEVALEEGSNMVRIGRKLFE